MHIVKSIKWTGVNRRAVVEFLSAQHQSCVIKADMIKLIGKSDWAKPGSFICLYSDGSCGVGKEVE